MATWQTILKKDIETVVSGHKEAAEFVPAIEEFTKTLDTGAELKADDVAKQLIDFKLGFFASKLLQGQYDAQAEFDNNTAAQQAQEAPILDNEGEGQADEGQPILTEAAAADTSGTPESETEGA